MQAPDNNRTPRSFPPHVNQNNTTPAAPQHQPPPQSPPTSIALLILYAFGLLNLVAPRASSRPIANTNTNTPATQQPLPRTQYSANTFTARPNNTAGGGALATAASPGQERQPIRRPPPPQIGGGTMNLSTGRGAHGTGEEKCFTDEEILSVHTPFTEMTERGVHVAIYEENGRHFHTIQQQASRGCSAGAAAMLILDLGRHLSDYNALWGRSLSDHRAVRGDIATAGLTPLVHEFEPNLTREERAEILENLLRSYGPAVVAISDNEVGGHFIVVDSIDANQAIVRDPYHGWRITVTREALTGRLSGNPVIQAQRP
jgi:hypothetical protein